MKLDEEYMQQVFELARQGTPSPNPYVGCVIVKDGKVIGEGYHHKAGQAHAEVEALRDCEKNGNSAAGATLYVNLEPCSHYGRTPPCVSALLEAKVDRVVISTGDPNPLVNGKGIEILRSGGIEVAQGVLEKEGKELNRHFFMYITQKRPFVYLKAAITLDGKIACANYDSKWISSEESRMLVHDLRGRVDAVLVGKNTIIQDNPQLNARHTEKICYPTRIILDSNDSLDDGFTVFQEEGETLVLTTKESIKRNRIVCEKNEGKVNLHDALTKLTAKGISSILVEGGSEVFGSFITEKLVDEFWLFIAPTILGDEKAIPLMNGFSPLSINDGIKFNFTSLQQSGKDIFVKGVFAR
ncbi:bifunctional diaminohydroxyphosphoribosylaminopyrimidine deaminase/5-amino-6-(5-phosphoribosylamino)uracil reductase RibD [Candidatus Woesearchaeota archaeon]|nr:bifunctional diaminohydroxyphosphoribosylaminopyrimidine deaminase/5-amino-6-(5-phosphoribosylamino)uracil reductase RibD [Candidatus Woesearchaeota archaeon]